MATSINWSEIGKVQRSFETVPDFSISSEQLKELGNLIGDTAGYFQRKQASDVGFENDSELSALNAHLSALNSKKQEIEASVAEANISGDGAVDVGALNVELQQVDAQIEEVKAKAEARKSELSKVAEDPEYATARLQYVNNNDRSGLDAFWRNQEAKKQRAAIEVQNKIELDKGKAAELANAKNELERRRVELKNATADEKEMAQVLYNQALAAVQNLEPEFKDVEGSGKETSGETDSALAAQSRIKDAKLKADELKNASESRDVTNKEVDELKASIEDLKGERAVAKEYADVLVILNGIETKEKRSARRKRGSEDAASSSATTEALDKNKKKKEVEDKIEIFNGKNKAFRASKKNSVAGAEEFGYKLKDFGNGDFKYIKG